MYLAIVIATIIVFLIAVYLATRKKETENANDFYKKEAGIVLENNQTKGPEIPSPEEKPENKQEPPFQPPSEPEIL